MRNKNYIFCTEKVMLMFGRSKKTGEVGINKEADRQLILWITKGAVEAINSENCQQLRNNKLTRTETVSGQTLSEAFDIWKNVELETICAKFITAYKKKIFSKSQKLVLEYFDALKAILDSKANPPTSDQLSKFSDACQKITTSDITNSRALLNLSKGNNNIFKSAMNQQITELERIIKQKQDKAKEKKRLQNWKMLKLSFLNC